MSDTPEANAELIRSVLPGMATGVVSRLHTLTGQPVTIAAFVIDVEGNLHGTNNFASNQDMEAFICSLADGYREKNEALGDEMLTRLYYEAHITVEPLDAESFGYSDFVTAVEQDHPDWQASKFEHDDVDDIAGKWFLSAKHRSGPQMRDMVAKMVANLKSHGFTVERAKIEEAIWDTKHGDTMESVQ